jgi:hypothetical protein
MLTVRSIRHKLIVATMLIQVGQPALAQIEKYDPNSGKYVTSDPFAQQTPSAPSPYRLNPRVSRNSVPQPAPGMQEIPGKAAPGVGVSASAAPMSALSQPLIPMDGMAMYGGDAGSDPFAKPDWWPQ